MLASPARIFGRTLSALLITVPLLWVGGWAYAQWVEPGANPPTSAIPGVVWLFGTGATQYNSGGVRVTGDITTQAAVNADRAAFFSVTNPTADVILSLTQTGLGKKALYAYATGAGSLAGDFAGMLRIDNDPLTGLAGCVRYNGTTSSLEYSNDCSTNWTPFGGAGSTLWTLEGSGPNIFKTDSSGIVKIGTTSSSLGTFAAGTKLGLAGAGTTGPRLYLAAGNGNPEIDFGLTASPESHWGVYTSNAATGALQNQLRLWQGSDWLALSTSGNLALGPAAVADTNGPKSRFDIDGVMTFRGWAPPGASVTTNAASPVGLTTTTLNGTVNPNGLATTAWFRYSTTNPGTCTDTFGTRNPTSGGFGPWSDSASHAFTANLTGLSTGVTYYYCAIGSNANGTSFGQVLSFVPSNAPSLGTPSTSNPQPTSVTLNGSANPNGLATTAWFNWGTSNVACASLANSTSPVSNLGSGGTSQAFTYNLTGLTAGTPYYYCAAANNSVGTTYSTVQTFTPVNTYTVTVNKAVNQGTVSGTGGISCDTACTTQTSSALNSGTSVSLTATAASGFTFTSWSVVGATCAGGPASALCVFTLGANTTATATFTAVPTYTITALKSPVAGGTVTGSGSLNCGATCTSTAINSGSSVSVTAVAASGYAFTSWSVVGATCAGGPSSNPCNFTLTANTTVTATFTAGASYVLTVAHTANRGTITGSVDCGLSCTSASGTFTQGTAINLSALGANGYDFSSWTLPAGRVCQETGDNLSPDCTFLMPGSNSTATANFILAP